jgi:hypothetical protein
MLKRDKLVLSSNYETYLALNELKIESVLWEDCFTDKDLLNLYKKYKKFCNSWFLDENLKDHSIYDGLSIGKSISIFLAYDLETWVRVFYLLEYLAKNRIETTLYVLDKKYFPDEVYEFIHEIQIFYNTKIQVISLGKKDHGIESSVNYVTSQKRCVGELRRSRKYLSIYLIELLKKIINKSPKEKYRCLIHSIRNGEEYFKTYFSNSDKYKDIRLYFSPFYYIHRRMFFNDIYKNKISMCIGNQKYQAHSQLDIENIGDVVRYQLAHIGFIQDIAAQYFFKIFLKYISKALSVQVNRYNYLLSAVEKNKINRILCDGPDTPETFFSKHIMDRVGGEAIFLSHGLMGRKDNELDLGRDIIAHKYFYYTNSEKDLFREKYNIPEERFFPVNFLSPNSLQKSTRKNAPKVLILLDNFQVCLASRINYFKYFSELINLCSQIKLTDVTVRYHGAFLGHYYSTQIDEYTKSALFNGVVIQKKEDVALKEIIGNYDIVIGPLTSSILEAIWAKVLFIPYIPNYFPAETIEDIMEIQWFPDLYPKPISDIMKLKDFLLKYRDTMDIEYSKYLRSIEKIGVCKTPSDNIWDNIS